MAHTSIFQIFVSHSHKDNEFGVKLMHDLKLKLGKDVNVWYDVAGGLTSGDNWWRKIVGELVASSVFIVILSPDAMKSPWVNDELDLARLFKNSLDAKLQLFIPILYKECEIRADLKTLQMVSFLAPTPYEAALGILTNRLEKFRSELSNSSTSYKSSDISSFSSSNAPISKDSKLLQKKVHKNLHSAYRRTALRQAQMEAIRQAQMEAGDQARREAEERLATDLESRPNKRSLNEPIILKNHSRNKEH